MQEIHTTLPKQYYVWLENKATKDKKYINEIIIDLIIFYQKNKELPVKYTNGTFFLKELIKEVMIENKEILNEQP